MLNNIFQNLWLCHNLYETFSWEYFYKTFLSFLCFSNLTLNNESESHSVCWTLCHAMDYTVHRILQAKILEWVAFPFSRRSSQPRDQTQVSLIAGGFFTSWTTREAQFWTIDNQIRKKCHHLCCLTNLGEGHRPIIAAVHGSFLCVLYLPIVFLPQSYPSICFCMVVLPAWCPVWFCQ